MTQILRNEEVNKFWNGLDKIIRYDIRPLINRGLIKEVTPALIGDKVQLNDGEYKTVRKAPCVENSHREGFGVSKYRDVLPYSASPVSKVMVCKEGQFNEFLKTPAVRKAIAQQGFRIYESPEGKQILGWGSESPSCVIVYEFEKSWEFLFNLFNSVYSIDY